MGISVVVVVALLCVGGLEVGRRAVVGRRLEHAFDDLRPLGRLDSGGAAPRPVARQERFVVEERNAASRPSAYRPAGAGRVKLSRRPKLVKSGADARRAS